MTTTVDGHLSISGEATGTGDFVHGVYAESATDAVAIAASGSADVAISGTAGGGVGPAAAGIELWGRVAVSAAAGDVSLEGRTADAGVGLTLDGATASSVGGGVRVAADSVSLGGNVSAAAGEVRLTVASAGRAIDVGVGDSAGALRLSDLELDRVSARTIVIGSLAAGPVTVSSAVGPRASSLFRIVSGGSVTIAADVDLRGTPGASFEVQAAGDVVQTGGSVVRAEAVLPAVSADAGRPDVRFGDDGTVELDLGGSEAFVAFAVQADGKVVAVGSTSKGAFGADMLVARYNRDGSLDGTFGDGGLAVIDLKSGRDVARAVAVLPDGRIVVYGETNAEGAYSSIGFLAALRLTPDGRLDTTFGQGGVFTTRDRSVAEAGSLALQPDGGMLLSGMRDYFEGPRFFVLRVRADGTVDRSFGVDGVASAAFGDESRRQSKAERVFLRPDGRILVAGWTSLLDSYAPYQADFALAQFLPDGTPDPSFGVGGRLALDWGRPEALTDAVLLSDGRLIAVGASYGHGDAALTIARLLADGTPDAGFGVGGAVVTPDAGAGPPSVALQPDGGFVVVTSISKYSSGVRLRRYTADGAFDPSYAFPAAVGIQGSGWLRDIEVTADGQILTVGYGGYGYDARLDRFVGRGYPVGGGVTYVAGGPVRVAAGGMIVAGGSVALTASTAATIEAGAAVDAGDTAFLGGDSVAVDGFVSGAIGGVEAVRGVVGGLGAIGGRLKVHGALTPGVSAADAFAVGGLVLTPGSTFRVPLTAASAGRVDVAGEVSLGGATLEIAAVGPLTAPGGRVTVIANDGTDVVAGTFSGLPEGAVIAVVDGRSVRVTYRGGDGNDVVVFHDGLPTPVADAVRTAENRAFWGDVLRNDGDPDGDRLLVYAVNGDPANLGRSVRLASGATVGVGLNGDLYYDPAGAFARLRRGETATDSFTYTVSDGHGGFATATVTVTIEGGAEADLIGYVGGSWHVAASNGTSFATALGAKWADAAWDELKTGDFDGDGRTDVLGLVKGEWYVGLARTANSGLTYFETALWGKWDAGTRWGHVLVGDLNGDRRADVVAESGGTWFGSISVGYVFETPQPRGWTSDAAWDLAALADVTGDRRDDLVLVLGGDWYVAAAAWNGFRTAARWARTGGGAYQLLALADLNKDGKADAVGLSGGEWRTGLSNGTNGFATGLRAKWANATWLDPLVGDFDGDGTADLAARYGGQWYVGLSNAAGGEKSRGLWASWNNLAWKDVRAGDFDGDGRAEVAGRYNGEWYVARSTGSGFTTSRWGRWTETAWRAVAAADADGYVPPVTAAPPSPAPTSVTTYSTSTSGSLKATSTATAPFAARAEDEPLLRFWSTATRDEELAAGLLGTR